MHHCTMIRGSKVPDDVIWCKDCGFVRCMNNIDPSSSHPAILHNYLKYIHNTVMSYKFEESCSVTIVVCSVVILSTSSDMHSTVMDLVGLSVDCTCIWSFVYFWSMRMFFVFLNQ